MQQRILVLYLYVLLFFIDGNQTVSCEETDFTLSNTFRSMNFGLKIRNSKLHPRAKYF